MNTTAALVTIADTQVPAAVNQSASPVVTVKDNAVVAKAETVALKKGLSTKQIKG
ncbi:hypothetical protein [Magnetospirillum fulvum]|uniref:Uncharacterized protein n=1 Tax=Magnetospirillum fulvum TaxID=1082 RepID=A0A1H6IRD6_MAGFU|nr:hypothetical protein [Magnetospirillum fulvum]SEH52312.1 hypothetical protein SAMN04244559_02783 [Magnetospirillum fulvum]